MRRGLFAGCALAAAALAHPGPAAGAPGIPVKITFDGCADALVPEVERIARIELHSGQSAGEPAGASTRIELGCEGLDAKITVDDPLTGKRVERTVSLAGVPEADRARLLALAIAELVRSSWIELELSPRPILPVAKPAEVTLEQREQARSVAVTGRRVQWHGYAAIEGLFIPSVGRPILGASLGAQIELPWKLYFDGGVSAWDGVTERATGAITVRQIALDPGLGFRLPIVDLALAARVGWANLTGSPSVAGYRGDTTSGFVFGPLLAASAPIVGPLRVWLKAGWLLQTERGLVAGDSDVVVGGPWASLALGLRYPP
jgi:hypothetical protein